MSPLNPNRLLCLLLCITVLFIGCSDKANDKENYPNSEMYDFADPTVIDLPVELDEISGLAYYPKDTSVFGVIDEDGLLFKIPIMNPKASKRWVFDKPRDFEDLVLIDSTFYALVSNGDIVQINFKGDTISIEKSEFSATSGKKTNEFEILYQDSGKLVMMCKECEADKKTKLTSYLFDPATKSYSPHLVINTVPLAAKLGKDKVALKPSAAAINPITNELYLVSSIEKVIVVLDKAGEIKETYKLNPKIYKQPEGIAFTPAGDLIISNEVFLEGHANLLILKNKTK